MKFGKKWNADNMRYIFFTLCNCFTGSCPHGEQAHRCLEQTQQEPDCPTHVLLLLIQDCVVQGRHHGLPHPLCVLRQ